MFWRPSRLTTEKDYLAPATLDNNYKSTEDDNKTNHWIILMIMVIITVIIAIIITITIIIITVTVTVTKNENNIINHHDKLALL